MTSLDPIPERLLIVNAAGRKWLEYRLFIVHARLRRGMKSLLK
jgi:hypothetical protein